MQKKVEQVAARYSWITAASLTVFLFLIFNIFSTPLLNSDDDTYFMYTLAGGYGEPASALLHYNFGWHPWLGGIVKNLFVAFPAINWYSIFLLLFHLAGCTAILYVLLKRLKTSFAFFFFIVFFFFMETRLLLSLTFTGAAFVAAAGASCLLIWQLQQDKLVTGNTVFALLLLILAGMLRIHVLCLVIFLFVPAAITLLRKKQFLRWTAVSLVILLVLFGLNTIQEKYYIKNIQGWQQQEKFRQAMFYGYNRAGKISSTAVAFVDSNEQQLFFAGFLYDSSRFTTARVATITKNIVRQRWMSDKNDRQALYWVFVEMRVYMLLFATVVITLLIRRDYNPVKKWLLSFFAVAAIYGYLFVFLKITATIHLGLLLTLWLHFALHLNRDSFLFSGNKKIAISTAIILLLLFGWMGFRVARENSTNLNRRQKFICAITELNRSPQHLFVSTDNSFPLNAFYIWNSPGQYPIKNLLYKERLLTHTYLQTLKRFGINNFQDALLHNKNVFLLGKPLPALIANDPSAKIEGPFPGYRCLEVRQLSAGE